MGLYISRGIGKVISWVAEVFGDMLVYFLLLVASMATASILMFLILILNFIFQELGQELGLEFVLIPDSTYIIYILIFLFFIVLYSAYIESKFIKYTISVRRILILVLPIIVYWLSLSSGAFQVLSELSTSLLYLVLYIFLLVYMVWWSIMAALLFRGVRRGHMVNIHFKHARSAVHKIIEHKNDGKCLFGWDNIPGEDSEKLASYLRKGHDIDWVESEDLHKSEDGKTIHSSNDKNSLKIMIDEKKEKGTLEINNARIYDLKVKKENGKLNIYEIKNYKNMYHIHTVSNNYKSGINEIKDLLRRGIDLNRNPNLNGILDRLAFSMQYYLFYGGYEQMESVKKHLDHITKNFDEQYCISLDQFICEISRMCDKIDRYFEKNEIRPTRSTGFAYHLTDHLLKKSPEIAAVVITVISIYLLRLLPYIIEWLPTKFPVPFP